MENGKRQIDEYIGKAFACIHQDLGVRTGKIKEYIWDNTSNKGSSTSILCKCQLLTHPNFIKGKSKLMSALIFRIRFTMRIFYLAKASDHIDDH